MILAKLVSLHGSKNVEERGFEIPATVEDLFEAVGVDYVEGCATRKGVVVTKDTELNDNDVIFYGRATKGNLDPFEVKFLRISSNSVINTVVEDGTTIKGALDNLSDNDRQEFYHADGKPAYEFRVSGNPNPVDETYALSRPTEGDSVRIVCSQRMKGNQ